MPELDQRVQVRLSTAGKAKLDRIIRVIESIDGRKAHVSTVVRLVFDNLDEREIQKIADAMIQERKRSLIFQSDPV